MTMKKIVLLLLALHVPAAGAAYRCVDEKGKTHIGDTPPAGCGSVPMQEVTKGGKVLRTIDPTLTEEQVKAKAVEAEQKRIADKTAADQKRKDTALLSSFASEKEFDVARDRNVEPIKARIGLARDRIKQIEKSEGKIQEEMEFYKAGKGKTAKAKEMPANLVEGKKGAEQERATIEKNIARFEREIEEIRTKFDTDKKRWVAIRAEQGQLKPATTAATAPAPVDAKADSKAAPKKN